MKENKWEGVERWREKGWKDGERERQRTRQSAGDIPSGRLMQLTLLNVRATPENPVRADDLEYSVDQSRIGTPFVGYAFRLF